MYAYGGGWIPGRLGSQVAPEVSSGFTFLAFQLDVYTGHLCEVQQMVSVPYRKPEVLSACSIMARADIILKEFWATLRNNSDTGMYAWLCSVLCHLVSRQNTKASILMAEFIRRRQSDAASWRLRQHLQSG